MLNIVAELPPAFWDPGILFHRVHRALSRLDSALVYGAPSEREENKVKQRQRQSRYTEVKRDILFLQSSVQALNDALADKEQKG